MLMEEFREAHRKMFGSQAVLNVEQNVSIKKMYKKELQEIFASIMYDMLFNSLL